MTNEHIGSIHAEQKVSFCSILLTEFVEVLVVLTGNYPWVILVSLFKVKLADWESARYITCG